MRFTSGDWERRWIAWVGLIPLFMQFASVSGRGGEVAQLQFISMDVLWIDVSSRPWADCSWPPQAYVKPDRSVFWFQLSSVAATELHKAEGQAVGG